MYELYIDRSVPKFGGYDIDYTKSYYIVVGAPLDATTSFVPGTRFAPQTIRLVSRDIEFNTLNGVDMDEYPGADLGDIITSSRPETFLSRMEKVLSWIIGEIRKPVAILGGEHTITLGVIRALQAENYKPCLIVFDAHLDYRDEYLGSNYSHATVTRRIAERIGAKNILVIGARAFSIRDELVLAKKHGLYYVESRDVDAYGEKHVAQKIDAWLGSRECNAIHISIDVDVVDPAYAPGVGNPEPFGLSPLTVAKLVGYSVRKASLLGFSLPTLDVVEVNPLRDCNNITSILAAKLVIEWAASVIMSTRKT